MNYTQLYIQNNKFQKHETWILDNLMLESIVGSHAYGCNNENSDYDIVGIVLPKAEHLFPQKFNFILGFDNYPKFERKELKGKNNRLIIDQKREVEAEWIGLIEFFVQAGLKGSPNLIEVLFVNKNFVTVGTKMGWYLRDKRRLFLSMKTYHAFKGYANGQAHRIRQRNPETEDRKEMVKKYGWDLKMGYHVFRLLNQLEQILTTNDIDLMQNKEEHKLIRSGLWGGYDKFDSEFQRRMAKLDDLVLKCSLSQFPNHDELKVLLQEILEEHYGSMMNFNSINKEQTEFISCKDVMEKLNQIENKIK
jgi:predicted nucleotidyltransferase